MTHEPSRFPDVRLQLCLLVWLCRDPARFTTFVTTTARARFNADLAALLLPKSVLPEVLFIEQKFSVGVTRMHKYTENFSTELRRAFDVPDHQIPQKIGLIYREETADGIIEGRLLLDPAAYRILRQRKLLTQHVQRLQAGLGITLALLPPTVITLAWFPALGAAFETLLLLLVALLGTWGILGRRIAVVETFAENMWVTAGLFCGGSTILLAGYGLTAASSSLLAIFSLALAIGISSGFCAVLPTHAPRRLLYGLALITAIFLLFTPQTGHIGVIFSGVVGSLALAVRWTLKRGLTLGRAIRVNTLWLLLLLAAYALIILAGIVAFFAG